MKINKIKLTNFEKFANETKEFEFDNNDNLIHIYGANGEGKTTIADAIFVAFTKKTYENKQFNPVNNESDVIIEIEFDVNGQKHTLTRIIQKKNGNNLWTTKINGTIYKEKDVIDVLEKTVGLIGIKNFFICVHPLYLIDPDFNTKESSLKLFFELMSKAAQPELKQIIDDLMQKKNNLENNEYIFSEEEISKLQINPLEIINSINNLNEELRDFKKEYDKKINNYSILKEQLSDGILSEEEILSLKRKIRSLEEEKNKIDNAFKIDEENKKKLDALKNDLKKEKDREIELKNELFKLENEVSSLNYNNFISQYYQEDKLKLEEWDQELAKLDTELEKVKKLSKSNV